MNTSILRQTALLFSFALSLSANLTGVVGGNVMTPRERILAVLHGALPDCVPCCPDISNMVPCRLTGKPFWDIYLYQDPPLWKAHIDALKYFDIDGGRDTPDENIRAMVEIARSYGRY